MSNNFFTVQTLFRYIVLTRLNKRKSNVYKGFGRSFQKSFKPLSSDCVFRFHYMGPSCAIDIALLWSGRVEAVAILVILEKPSFAEKTRFLKSHQEIL